jgi:ribosome-binding factor A
MNSHLRPLATRRASASEVEVYGMKKHSQRAQRVGDQIQRELAELLRLHVKDPRIGMVTVTAVEVSPDLSHAKIFVTHLGGAEQAAAVVAALQHTSGYLRRELSHRLDLYSVPQLHFAYDDSIESGLRLSKLIDDAIADDHKHSS